MNTFYYFVSSNLNSSPIIGIYNILERNEKLVSKMINLSTCGDTDRQIAIKNSIETTPCLLILNENSNQIEKMYGPVYIVNNLKRSYNMYGISK